MPAWKAASSLQVTTHLILILAPQSISFSSVFKKWVAIGKYFYDEYMAY